MGETVDKVVILLSTKILSMTILQLATLCSLYAQNSEGKMSPLGGYTGMKMQRS